MVKVRDLIGKPYSVHGRGPDSFDCYGLAIEVCRRFGRELPDAIYGELSGDIKERLIDSTKSALRTSRIEKPVEGAIVELAFSGRPSHVGVCLGDGTFIHATEDTGVRIDTLRLYSKQIRGFYIW